MSSTKFRADAQSLITADAVNAHNAPPGEHVDEVEFRTRSAQLFLTLEIARQGFAAKRPAAEVVANLAGELHRIRQDTNRSVWQRLIPVAQEHQVSEYLLQDPFTGWSFNKPRGYSGDATLLDIYYKHESAAAIVDSSTDLGKAIYAYTSDAESSKAGRERRRFLAEAVDAAAERAGSAEVLAIACGHMREAELAASLKAGKVKRWIGLDQDPISVATVNASQYHENVSAIEGSVRGILRRSYALGTFDLVYASGLFDYLPHGVGVRLIQRALELVTEGGEFLFANFSDEIETDGYMETFMDWPLILRSADDMQALIDDATGRGTVDAEVYYGTNRNIVYGKITKQAG